MTSTALDSCVRINVDNRKEMDLQLQANVAILLDRAATCQDRGILVTRHTHSDFTLEIHTGIPYGEIREADQR